MADINRMITLIDKYFESTGQNRVEANEISVYLEKNGALSHSTKGQPLRKLLREGKYPMQSSRGVRVLHGTLDTLIEKMLRQSTLHNHWSLK